MSEQYLTIDELCSRIKYSKQSIYNLIHKGALLLGTHFLKPTPKKLLFKWAAMKVWIGDTAESDNCSGIQPQPTERPESLINI